MSQTALTRLSLLFSSALIPCLSYSSESDLQEILLARYQAFVEATSDGSLEMAEQTISARSIQVTRNALSNSGRVLSPDSFSYSRPRPRFSAEDIEFVISNGPTAGLALKSSDIPTELQVSSSGKQVAAFTFVRFVLEDDIWKHDTSVTRYEPLYTEEGKVQNFDESWITNELAIDGIVRPIPDPVPVVAPGLVGNIVYSCNECQLKLELNDIVQDPSVPFIEGGLREGENRLVLSLYRSADSESSSDQLSVYQLIQEGQLASMRTLFKTNIGEMVSGTYEFTFELR